MLFAVVRGSAYNKISTVNSDFSNGSKRTHPSQPANCFTLWHPTHLVPFLGILLRFLSRQLLALHLLVAFHIFFELILQERRQDLRTLQDYHSHRL